MLRSGKYKKPKFALVLRLQRAGTYENRCVEIGRASVALGCGRKKVSDKIDYATGIILEKKQAIKQKKVM